MLRAFGQRRTSIPRAGVIVGPHDGIGRLPWWLDRIRRGGEVLAPGDPGRVVRMIDARDIAEFALRLPPGTFEVTGPANQVRFGQLLEDARRVAGSDATLRWVSDAFLEGKVEGWTEMPLWTASAGAPGLFAHHPEAAEAAGLVCRPVLDTLVDTWRWMQTIEGGWRPSQRTPGLAPENERALPAEAP